jgi:hypothetical protein
MMGTLVHETREHYMNVNIGKPDAPVIQRKYIGRTHSTFYPDECRHGAPACPGCESWPQKVL